MMMMMMMTWQNMEMEGKNINIADLKSKAEENVGNDKFKG